MFSVSNIGLKSKNLYTNLIMKKVVNGLRTWLEIDRKNIEHNYKIFRSLIAKKTKLMAIVKSNAYGHSLIDFSKEIVKQGADWLGVDSIVEAVALRQAGVKSPILVLGYTLPGRLEEASDYGISITVSSFELLEKICRRNFKKLLKVHVKVDTGMHRQGFQLDEFPKFLNLVKNLDKLVLIEGLYTHFAAAKNPAFPEQTKRQLKEFDKWIQSIRQSGFSPIIHAAASAGTILFPESHFDMVRIGIGLYGIWPAKEVREFCRGKFELKPAMVWKTIISEIKVVKKCDRVGYDYTEIMKDDSKVAICPVGYWHGYARALSSIGWVSVNGRGGRVIGRVSMDMIVIDISKIKNVKIGDEVVLMDSEKDAALTAEEIGNLIDRSPYEIITCINPLIKRIYSAPEPRGRAGSLRGNSC